ncbi:unnamed protein product [Lymnaea stagnalis]|uniref:Fucolectin tachylectin-4 pentraxin-1 domain-containing protein n=1 Tax=Lymnaea stagnalis TaxID=6523 RepID=A0AAV2HZD8_LYMST
MSSSDIDCTQLPLCENPPTDDGINEEERRDDVAVLTSENGLTGSRALNGKRSLYLIQPRLPKLRLNCRWKHGIVLGLGIFLTIIALTLVVVGAVRSREHSTLRLIHVKQPVDLKSIMYLADDNFTFAQLLSLSNLALDKRAFQSSMSKRDKIDDVLARAQAGLAVDGDITSCSSTGLERSPMWYVDINSDKVVRSVRMQGSNVNKLHDIQVYVSKASNSTSDDELCGGFVGEAKTLDVRVNCYKKMIGRYVIIELQTKTDTYESLVLCEVMVFQ